MAVRPANDWLTDSRRVRFWEPVMIHRPGLGSSSIRLCKYEGSWGQRWTSSMMAPSGNWARKARGSCRANDRTSGNSKLAEPCLGNTARHSVDFPLCRGPVRVTAGKPAAAALSRSVRSRGIITPAYTHSRLIQDWILNQPEQSSFSARQGRFRHGFAGYRMA